MKYKLVPVKPTPEMIHAGQMAVSGFPRDVLERWQAMLAAAPAVEQEPFAWISPNALSRLSPDSPVNCALVHKQHINETFPLYLHPQPTPEVAKLVEVLDEMIDVAKRVDSWESFPSDPIERAEDAIRAYRKQGGDL